MKKKKNSEFDIKNTVPSSRIKKYAHHILIRWMECVQYRKSETQCWINRKWVMATVLTKIRWRNWSENERWGFKNFFHSLFSPIRFIWGATYVSGKKRFHNMYIIFIVTVFGTWEKRRWWIFLFPWYECGPLYCLYQYELV